MRDIVHRLGENFSRLRIGAGRPEHGDLANFVLSNISLEKMDLYRQSFEKCEKVIKYFISKKTVEGIDINKL